MPNRFIRILFLLKFLKRFKTLYMALRITPHWPIHTMIKNATMVNGHWSLILDSTAYASQKLFQHQKCLNWSPIHHWIIHFPAFGGEKWKSNVLLTAFLIPGIVFADFFVLNSVLWVKHSSAAIPFSTLIALLALWFGVSTPLVFLGAYFGYKKRVSWYFNVYVTWSRGMSRMSAILVLR